MSSLISGCPRVQYYVLPLAKHEVAKLLPQSMEDIGGQKIIIMSLHITDSLTTHYSFFATQPLPHRSHCPLLCPLLSQPTPVVEVGSNLCIPAPVWSARTCHRGQDRK